jgi:outer membrane protein assembly factor BamB
MTEAGFNNGNGYQKKAYRGDEYATAWNIETGALVWATKLTDYGVAWYDGVHWGYPSSSPLIADGKVYIFNEQSELYCLDAATGSLVWPQPIKMWDHGMWAWTVGQCGSATSPLKVGNAIIVTYSGSGNSNYTQWGQYKRIAAAFDATTGNHLWTRPAPRDGAFYQPSRITYAEINEDPTVLMSYGGGVAGINPANGSIRWSYEHPYGSYYANWDVYNPVVYQNYVVISEPLAHDDAESATFGIQITNNQPTLLWETHAFVVNGHGEKNNMVAWDGKIYGFDAHGVWDIQPWTSYERDHHGSSASGPGRNYRGEEAGRFQCLDIASGDMLWSSHAFDPASYELNFNPFILCGNHIIATERNGLWVGNISANGVNITGRIGGATNARILGEPVVCGPNLYIRQIDTESSQWVTDIGTNQGNLTILGHQRIITSANEMEGQPVTGITLYPNPTCDRITISLDELLNEAGICIFGPDGRICHSESLYKNTSDICVKGLSPGVYVVKVNNGDHVWHSRMVIK